MPYFFPYKFTRIFNTHLHCALRPVVIDVLIPDVFRQPVRLRSLELKQGRGGTFIGINAGKIKFAHILYVFILN
jgi:hypothetical protein